jgi:hypothetical protein
MNRASLPPAGYVATTTTANNSLVGQDEVISENINAGSPKKPIGFINFKLMEMFGNTTQDQDELKDIYKNQFEESTNKNEKYFINCETKTTRLPKQCKDHGTMLDQTIGNAKSLSSTINNNLWNLMKDSNFSITKENLFPELISYNNNNRPKNKPDVKDDINYSSSKGRPTKTGFNYWIQVPDTHGEWGAFRYFDEMLILPPELYLYMKTNTLDTVTISFTADGISVTNDKGENKEVNDEETKQRVEDLLNYYFPDPNPNPNKKLAILVKQSDDKYTQEIDYAGDKATTTDRKAYFSPVINKEFIDSFNSHSTTKTSNPSGKPLLTAAKVTGAVVVAPVALALAPIAATGYAGYKGAKLGAKVIDWSKDNNDLIKGNVSEWNNHFYKSTGNKDPETEAQKKAMDKNYISIQQDDSGSSILVYKDNIKDNIIDLMSDKNKNTLKVIVLAIAHSIYSNNNNSDKLLDIIEGIRFAYDDVKGRINRRVSSQFLSIIRDICRINFENNYESSNNDFVTVTTDPDAKRKEEKGLLYLDALVEQMIGCYKLGDENKDYHKGIHLRKNCTHAVSNSYEKLKDILRGSNDLAALPRVSALFLDLYRSLIPGISTLGVSDPLNSDYFQGKEQESLGKSRVGRAFDYVTSLPSRSFSTSSPQTPTPVLSDVQEKIIKHNKDLQLNFDTKILSHDIDFIKQSAEQTKYDDTSEEWKTLINSKTVGVRNDNSRQGRMLVVFENNKNGRKWNFDERLLGTGTADAYDTKTTYKIKKPDDTKEDTGIPLYEHSWSSTAKGGKLSRKKSKTQKKLRFQKKNKTNKRKMSIKHKKRIQVKKGHKKTSKK